MNMTRQKKCIRYKYVGLWTNGKREGIFERYVYNEGNTYNLSSYIIYENDEEKRRYIVYRQQGLQFHLDHRGQLFGGHKLC